MWMMLFLTMSADAAPGVGPKGQALEARKPGGPGMGRRPRGKGPMAKIAETGNARLQMIAAKMAWNDDHTNVDNAIKYGLALLKFGKCEEMLDVMGPLTDEPGFPVNAFYGMAQCSAKIGLYEDALYYNDMALEQDESRVRGLTLEALYADELGDVARRETALWELAGLGLNGGDPVLLAEATLAVRRGDVETLDVCLAMWERSGWQKQDAERLSAQLWLDLDNPLETLALTSAFRANRQAGRFIYAEAYRRIGEYPTTIFKLENINQRVAEGVNTDTVLARAYTDARDFRKAHELLELYGDTSDPDVVASRWYLARAENNTEQQAREAALWQAMTTNPLRSLEQLIPW